MSKVKYVISDKIRIIQLQDEIKRIKQSILNLLDSWAIEQITKPSILTYDLNELKKRILELK